MIPGYRDAVFRSSLLKLQSVAGTLYRNALPVLIVMLLLPAFAFGENDLRVLLVLSDNNTPYHAFAKTFQQNLPEYIHVNVLERAENFPLNEQRVDLIVTVGINAADWVSGRTTTPLLAAMIPAAKYADLLKKQPRASQVSAIYIDQPWARQADLLHAAMPDRNKIGVLYSADTRLDLQSLRNVLSNHGLKLVARQIQSNATLSSDLEEALAQSEVLLAIPDISIYNSNNIRNILLSSYQQRIPLVGLSQAYVNAGALCAVFSTPEQLATQASVAVTLYAKTKHLPEPQSPTLYTIAVNPDVARTLGISIKSADFLHMQVEKAGGVP